MIEIRRCGTGSEYATAVKMTKDYIEWLDIDLAFQSIDKELSNFPSMYGPPHGMFLLAWHETELAGGVGLRILTPGVCEMKRLFVYDRFKGMGLGRRLCSQIIEEAKKLGYEKMRLDTLGRMVAAKNLYDSFGFKEIESYRFNPDPTTKYMELILKL
jgi:GNAT superfamily N-acetyltransferase